MKILFVCTANICRSFTAERILKGKLKEKECDVEEVSSAGLSDVMEGMPGDPRAVEMLVEKGFDGHGHESRLLTGDMVAEADKIIVMENIHREEIVDKYPDAEDITHLLKAFSADYNGSNSDIKDPYGLLNYHYRLCFAEIYLAVEGLVKKCI